MIHPLDGENAKNYELFRESLSVVLIEKLTRPHTKPKPKRRRSAPVQNGHDDDECAETNAEELADFIDYIASEVFESLPPELQCLAHHTWADDKALQERYSLPLTATATAEILSSLDPAIADSLATYNITTGAQTPLELLGPVLGAYISAASAAPAPPISTKAQAEGCEICGRDWINLTYHHLIPRFVHAKVLKRGWHRPDELQNVAWLCGACHRAVHRFANHEELARTYYTVELLLEQEEIRKFAEWVGRLRWKKK